MRETRKEYLGSKSEKVNMNEGIREEKRMLMKSNDGMLVRKKGNERVREEKEKNGNKTGCTVMLCKG